MQKLSDQERNLFSLVSRVAFANPFSPERVRLDIAIAGKPESTPMQERLDGVVATVAGAVQKLKDRQRADISFYAGNDRHWIG